MATTTFWLSFKEGNDGSIQYIQLYKFEDMIISYMLK